MANVVNGSTMKVDTTGDVLIKKNIIVTRIIVNATAASAVLELQDSNGTTFTDKIRIDVKDANDTGGVDLSETPMVFPNGVRVKTITNCESTIIFRRQGI